MKSFQEFFFSSYRLSFNASESIFELEISQLQPCVILHQSWKVDYTEIKLHAGKVRYSH